jgi:tRNA dimethylallyltransferase
MCRQAIPHSVKRNTLIALIGPTGVGKTDLSLELAQHCHCSIVSADSRQIFSGISIGTAAPTPEQLQQVKHYFVHTLPLDGYYSAARYADEALALLDTTLFPQNPVALLSGGSMMYVDAVCNGIDDIPTITTDTRQMLQQRYAEVGIDALRDELRLLDPTYYAKADLKNPKRIVHALEVCYQTGRPFSSFHTAAKVERPFNIIKIGLNRERSELFQRINTRVDLMMQQGLLDEARRVYPMRHLNSLNTVGYKEMFAYIDGLCTLDEAVEKIKKNTRVYAKKQLTWFKRDADIHWFHPDERRQVIDFIDARLSDVPNT